ncbi:hypothetical protein MF406_14100 [Georgenia sp. TF02-10]|uniref:hypothetical protein n=1 Tax=Georgenia sp. TF02-10 TaxID=2917725 RepID=UPI001FA79266|nr:hypothetical protein [Georgenia sp. TF02-10]UNX54065.1 hypothetical protein MF406_14100 [Georgenia sp. TF02-10]
MTVNLRDLTDRVADRADMTGEAAARVVTAYAADLGHPVPAGAPEAPDLDVPEEDAEAILGAILTGDHGHSGHLDTVAEATAARESARAALDAADTAWRQAIRDATAAGHSRAEVAAAAGVSRSRVHQVVGQ